MTRTFANTALGIALAGLSLALLGGCTPSIEKLWEFPTGSPLYSTPLVIDDQIFFGSESGTLHAVDNKGKARWQYSAPSAEIFSRPVTDGKLIFFGATNQTFYAIDLTGQAKWQFSANERIKSDASISEGVVYATSYDGHIYAIKAETGKLVWKFPPKPEPKPAEPDPKEGSDKKDEETKAADEAKPADGAEPEIAAKPAGEVVQPKAFSYAAPAIKDGVLYVGNLDGYMYALNTADGSLRWRFKTAGGVTSSALVTGGMVYFGSKDDHVYAIDAATGTQVKWKHKAGGDVISSPKIQAGVLWIGSNDKNIYALDAKTGAEKCKFTTQGEVVSFGAFYKDLVIFGSGQGDGRIYALEQATCKAFYTYKTGYKIESDPVVVDNRLYITSGDRKLYAFQINKTTN